MRIEEVGGGLRIEGVPFCNVFGFRRGHEAFGEELGEVLAEG